MSNEAKPVDVSKLREGDVVWIRCRVQEDGKLHDIGEDGLGIPYAPWSWLPAVKHIEPRPLGPGDRVHSPRGGFVAEILAVHGTHLWVLRDCFAVPITVERSEVEQLA